MEIQNNKEEIPFSYYADLFAQADPAEITARLGIPFENNTFKITLLGTDYLVHHPKGETVGVVSQSAANLLISMPASGRHTTIPDHIDPKKIPLPVQTFLLRYLLEGKTVPWNGTWKTFREMPWGELYIKPYTGRVLTRAAFTFGTRLAAFKAAAEKLGATPVPNGDAGFEFTLIGNYKMRILVWEGDDEFPPNAQVLYSDNFETGFAPEDRVVSGDILITTIKSAM